MRITKQNVRVVEDDNSRMVEGYTHPARPGVAAGKRHDSQRADWLLVHTNSGYKCGTLPTKQLAIRALRELIAAGVNWTLDPNTLRNTYGACHLRGLVADAITAACDRFKQRRLFPQWA